MKRPHTTSGRPKKEKRIGRPAFVPTPQQRNIVKLMASAGLTHQEIASAIGIGERSVRRHFATELKNAKALLIGAAVGVLSRAMRSGGRDGVLAAIFTLKCRGGWSEKGLGLPEESADNALSIHLPPGMALPQNHTLAPFAVVAGGKKDG